MDGGTGVIQDGKIITIWGLPFYGKCRFALAISLTEKSSFCPQKIRYGPVSEGRISNDPFHITYIAWSDPDPAYNQLHFT